MGVSKLKLSIFLLCFCTVHGLPLMEKWRSHKGQVDKSLNWNRSEERKSKLRSLRSIIAMANKNSGKRREDLDAECAYVGKFPMKNYCEGFVECHMGKSSKLEAFTSTCPEGKEYSINYRRCIHPQIARCSYNQHHPDEGISTPTIQSEIDYIVDVSTLPTTTTTEIIPLTTEIKLSYRAAQDNEEEQVIPVQNTFIDSQSRSAQERYHQETTMTSSVVTSTTTITSPPSKIVHVYFTNSTIMNPVGYYEAMSTAMTTTMLPLISPREKVSILDELNDKNPPREKVRISEGLNNKNPPRQMVSQSYKRKYELEEEDELDDSLSEEEEDEYEDSQEDYFK